MQTPDRNFPPGGIRASDADRDLAVDDLSEHFQAGRLTKEEFDDRSGRALRARTGQELTDLFVDLPRGYAEPPPGFADRPRNQAPTTVTAGGPPLVSGRRPTALAIVCIVAAVTVINVLFNSPSGHHGGLVLPIPVLIILLVIRRARAR